jgi:hypothetical protein
MNDAIARLAPADYYDRLTERNAGVIEPAVQAALHAATILVAGCGSIGGAAVEPLARLGARDFLLADPGEYELNNLNRQDASAADVGRNKAEVAAERVRAVYPYAQVQVFADGVTAENAAALVANVDLVVDGVDVTTASGFRAKVALHEAACAAKLPLLTGWDMAGAQYVRVYDYRRIDQIFDGALTREDVDRLSMWQLLRRLVPARYVPLEMVSMTRANLTNPSFTFPQLVYAADLFGALASHIVAQLLAGRPVRDHVYVDLFQEVRPPLARWRARFARPLEVVRALTQLRFAAQTT